MFRNEKWIVQENTEYSYKDNRKNSEKKYEFKRRKNVKCNYW